MAISIQSNVAVLQAQRALLRANERLRATFERLSSGSRINRASDDAAGLSIALRLHSNSRVYGQAIRNLNDGLSALNIAEGGLSELSNIGMRLKELATQASNGVFSLSQRRSLQSEADSLVEEFNRTINSLSFNGLRLLDRSLSQLNLQGGFGTAGVLSFSLGGQLSRNVGTGDFEAHDLSVLRNDGGVFTQVLDAASADFNGDGNIDLVLASSDGLITALDIAYGNGKGGFGSTQTYYLATDADKIVVGDINGDGRSDIVARSGAQTVDILLRSGSSFSHTANVDLGVAVTDLALADLNGDGRADLLHGTSSGGANVRVRLADGSGGFGAVSQTLSGSGTLSQVKTGDFNADGHVDLVFANTTTQVFTFLGSSAGTFSSGTTTTVSGAFIGALSVGDFNRDGWDDIAAGSGSTIHLLTGNGDATFNVSKVSSTGLLNIESADFNGDGYLDLLGADGDLYWGDGAGGFTKKSGAILSGHSIAVGDADGDGVPDVLGGIGDNAGGNIYYRFFEASSEETTTIGKVDLTSRQDALATLTTVDEILNRINKELGVIGANQSRISVAMEVLRATQENSIAAASRITDIDVAQESASLVRLSIAQQASASVLAQANLQPQIALLLLQS